MAYIRDSKANGGNQVTVTADSGLDIQLNDLLVFIVYKDSSSGGAWALPTGYTQQANLQGGNISAAMFTKVATASETAPSSSTSDSARDSGSYFISIGNIDTSAAVNGANSQTTSGVTHTSPSITTTSNANMLMYFQFNDTSGTNRNGVTASDLMSINHAYAGLGVQSLGAWTYQASSGAIPTPAFELMSSETGITFSLAVKSAASVVIPPHTSTNSTDVIHALKGKTTSSIWGGGDVDLSVATGNSDIASINGITYNHKNMGSVEQHTNGADNTIYPPTPSSTSSNGMWGSCWNLSAGAVDLSGKTISINTITGFESIRGLPPLADTGAIVGLRSGTGNYRIWNVVGKDTFPKGNRFQSVILEVDNTTFRLEDIGTFNSAAVDGIVLATHKIAFVHAKTSFHELRSLNTLTVVGGGATLPATLRTLQDINEASQVLTVLSQEGASTSQFFSLQDIQIGDGSLGVYFSNPNTSLEFATVADTSTKKVQYQADAGQIGLTLYGVSGDHIDVSNITMSGKSVWNYTIEASSTSAATWISENHIIIGANVTLQDVFTAASGMSFIDCPTFTGNSADLTGGCTFDNTPITVTSAAEFADIHNCTLKNSSVAITITGDQAGTWSDPNITVSGNTYDIEYTGTTNFSIQSANALTVNNTSSGVLTIVTPTFDLTVDSSETGSQIHVYATGTQTIIDSEASASQLVYTHSGQTVDITVLKDGFIPFRQTDVVLSGNVTVDVQLVASREYTNSHGLTYPASASWSRTNNELTIPTWGVAGQAVFSLMMEAFKSQSSLYNTDFNLEMDGAGSLYLVDGAEGATDASIENLIECGCAYLDSSGITTASWVGVKSVGTATGFTGEYQQDAGGSIAGTTNARDDGIFNEVIKMYGDGSHGNFDYTDHLVLKYQPNTYREVRSDVLADYGLTALSPTLYILAMEPTATNITAGDPAVSITVTDHGASPVTWNSKDWSITITDSGAVSGEDILRELNYNLSLDTTYQGKDPFNWPEMVVEAGSAYESLQGVTEGGAGAALKGVRVLRGASPHPDFTRMQADDGTYYTVPVTANGSITGIVSGSRVRIYNETKTTETYNDVPGTSYAVSYTNGTTYDTNDVIKIYITQTSGTTAQLPFTTTVVASSTGWSALAEQVSDDVYDGYGLNGSSYTGKFSADYANEEVDVIVASNFGMKEMYSWWCYNLTTSQGIADFFGGITAQDAANIRINNSVLSMYLDNTTTTNIYQTDNIRIYRTDEAYPVKNPTSGGGGIDVVWRDRVYIAETGVSGLTASESTQLFAASTFDPAVDVVEGSETWQESMKLVRAEAAGKVAVSGNTVTFRDAADTKDRIAATVDDQGQRTAITTDVS